MQFRVALCIVALAAGASANATANFFIDQVLGELQIQVQQNGLDPLRVVPFQLKVKGNGVTNRDLKANITQGTLSGLSRLARQGDCAYGTYLSGVKIGCFVTLLPVQLLLNADVKGDSIFGSKHAIATSTSISPTSFVLIEVHGLRGGPAILDRITVKPISMVTSIVQGKLDLNTSRMTDFTNQLHEQLVKQLTTTLTGTYASAVAAVVSRRAMP